MNLIRRRALEIFRAKQDRINRSQLITYLIVVDILNNTIGRVQHNSITNLLEVEVLKSEWRKYGQGYNTKAKRIKKFQEFNGILGDCKYSEEEQVLLIRPDIYLGIVVSSKDKLTKKGIKGIEFKKKKTDEDQKLLKKYKDRMNYLSYDLQRIISSKASINTILIYLSICSSDTRLHDKWKLNLIKLTKYEVLKANKFLEGLYILSNNSRSDKTLVNRWKEGSV